VCAPSSSSPRRGSAPSSSSRRGLCDLHFTFTEAASLTSVPHVPQWSKSTLTTTMTLRAGGRVCPPGGRVSPVGSRWAEWHLGKLESWPCVLVLVLCWSWRNLDDVVSLSAAPHTHAGREPGEAMSCISLLWPLEGRPGQPLWWGLRPPVHVASRPVPTNVPHVTRCPCRLFIMKNMMNRVIRDRVSKYRKGLFQTTGRAYSKYSSVQFSSVYLYSPISQITNLSRSALQSVDIDIPAPKPHIGPGKTPK